MAMCSLKRLLQVRLTSCILFTVCVYVIVRLDFSFYGQYDYAHIPEERIQEALYRATVPYLRKTSDIDCTYNQILTSTKSLRRWEVLKKYDGVPLPRVVNGSYSPGHCNPLFSVAVLVTYRDRQEQLNVFPHYMHHFLSKQNIHYKIYIIEQQDEKPWNKGLLYNIGAARAIADKFPCLILHDIDLLPLDESNLYVCTTQPRHMSGSLDKFRYLLPYDWLVGGVLAIRADQYVLVDGFSHRFLGWGGEDDDLWRRLTDHHLSVVRFPRTMSRYTMLAHQPAARNPERRRIMAENKRRPDDSGYRTLPRTSIDVRDHHLYTLIKVRT